jgi:hypothetical protein
MRVGGIFWGRRPPKAGGGPVLRRRPALRAGRRPKRKFIMGNGISDNLLYDWLHKHHDIYDDLIVKFFIYCY